MSPSHSQRLPPAPQTRLNQSFDQQLGSPHIDGYVWDEREQRFYRINNDAPANERVLDPAFLGEGLLNRTDSDLMTAMGRPTGEKEEKVIPEAGEYAYCTGMIKRQEQ